MNKPAYIYNTKCLKCSCLNHEMIKIGPMVFCISCFNEEFSGVWDVDSNEIDTKSQEYQDWLEAYKKYIDETYKGT